MADLMSVMMDLQSRVGLLREQVEEVRGQVEEMREAGAADPLGEVLLRIPYGPIGGDGGTLVGNTGDSVPVSGRLKLVSAGDSNVVIRTQEESDDESADGTVEIGVYYV